MKILQKDLNGLYYCCYWLFQRDGLLLYVSPWGLASASWIRPNGSRYSILTCAIYVRRPGRIRLTGLTVCPGQHMNAGSMSRMNVNGKSEGPMNFGEGHFLLFTGLWNKLEKNTYYELSILDKEENLRTISTFASSTTWHKRGWAITSTTLSYQCQHHENI